MENKVLIFCPVFNEIQHLPKLLERINESDYRGNFYFIDSGSTDGSSEFIENSGHNFISLEKNLVDNPKKTNKPITKDNVEYNKIICLVLFFCSKKSRS